MEMPNLESKLKAHDWFYHMSDDHRAYTRGRMQSTEINNLMELARVAGDGAAAAELYNKYNPNAQATAFRHAQKICQMYLDDDGTYSVNWLTEEEYEAQN